MQYLINLIDAIAWPVCIIIIALLFRKQLGSALGQLEHLKYKDFEAKFRRQLDEIESKAREAGLLRPINSKAAISGLPEKMGDQIHRISEISPRAAVSEMWVLLESLISNSAEQHQVSTIHRAPTLAKLRALVEAKVTARPRSAKG